MTINFMKDPIFRDWMTTNAVPLLVDFDLKVIKAFVSALRVQAEKTNRFAEATIWVGKDYGSGDTRGPLTTVKMGWNGGGTRLDLAVAHWPYNRMTISVGDPLRTALLFDYLDQHRYDTAGIIKQWFLGDLQPLDIDKLWNDAIQASTPVTV